MIEVCDFVCTERQLMVELKAKDKEQAVLHLHRIYDLQPVIHGMFCISSWSLTLTMNRISPATGPESY